MNDVPTNIRALQAQQTLELTWDSGSTSHLRYHLLRGECPCATCQNEWTGERILDPATLPADLTIAGLEPIGNYAVRIVWSDGHSSGLYSWETLRRFSESSHG